MLRHLAINNFRSIRSADIQFSQSGLNVIVGANGSGKSNLVKFLEFLAAVSRDGLVGSLQLRGREGVVPKSLPASEVDGTAFSFRYGIDLPLFLDQPADAPVMRVQHGMKLIYRAEVLPVLDSEDLTFYEPLLVQHFLRRKGASETASASVGLEDLPEAWRQSSIVFRRGAQSGVTISADPLVDPDNVAAYLRWFNLEPLAEHFQGGAANGLMDFLSQFLNRPPRVVDPLNTDAEVSEQEEAELNSFLNRAQASPLSIAPEFEAFRKGLSMIRRYDFQLSELRRDQRPQISALTRSGRGMPGAVRRLREAQDAGAAWERIVGTMSTIAPHVLGTQVSSPAPDREFVEFIESRVGRPVESWESSDGTLRALATLVALERHPASGTILIEEPEQGLHPWAISALMEHIRDAIRLRGLQVILTTHSQQVLEAIEPAELLVAERTPSEGTRFLTLEQLLPASHQVSMGAVGRLWVKGLLRGVPSSESRES